MSRAPIRFDVFRAGVIGANALGDYLETIEARSHRHAKKLAGLAHGRGAVVVLPTGRADAASNAGPKSRPPEGAP